MWKFLFWTFYAISNLYNSRSALLDYWIIWLLGDMFIFLLMTHLNDAVLAPLWKHQLDTMSRSNIWPCFGEVSAHEGRVSFEWRSSVLEASSTVLHLTHLSLAQ